MLRMRSASLKKTNSWYNISFFLDVLLIIKKVPVEKFGLLFYFIGRKTITNRFEMVDVVREAYFFFLVTIQVSKKCFLVIT